VLRTMRGLEIITSPIGAPPHRQNCVSIWTVASVFVAGQEPGAHSPQVRSANVIRAGRPETTPRAVAVLVLPRRWHIPERRPFLSACHSVSNQIDEGRSASMMVQPIGFSGLALDRIRTFPFVLVILRGGGKKRGGVRSGCFHTKSRCPACLAHIPGRSGIRFADKGHAPNKKKESYGAFPGHIGSQGDPNMTGKTL